MRTRMEHASKTTPSTTMRPRRHPSTKVLLLQEGSLVLQAVLRLEAFLQEPASSIVHRAPAPQERIFQVFSALRNLLPRGCLRSLRPASSILPPAALEAFSEAPAAPLQRRRCRAPVASSCSVPTRVALLRRHQRPTSSVVPVRLLAQLRHPRHPRHPRRRRLRPPASFSSGQRPQRTCRQQVRALASLPAEVQVGVYSEPKQHQEMLLQASRKARRVHRVQAPTSLALHQAPLVISLVLRVLAAASLALNLEVQVQQVVSSVLPSQQAVPVQAASSELQPTLQAATFSVQRRQVLPRSQRAAKAPAAFSVHFKQLPPRVLAASSAHNRQAVQIPEACSVPARPGRRAAQVPAVSSVQSRQQVQVAFSVQPSPPRARVLAASSAALQEVA